MSNFENCVRMATKVFKEGNIEGALGWVMDAFQELLKERESPTKITVCPICSADLRPTPDNKYYFMCDGCVEGWTWEELNGIFKYKQILKEMKL